MSSWAWCVCRVPQPRLVCAEYTQSKAVVIAKLVGLTSDSKAFPSYFIYKLVVIRRLRGQVPHTFDLFEGNDSGRAPFDWKLNTRYLLFLEGGAAWSHYDWTIDGCGNSGPLTNASSALREIQHISDQRFGLISGAVKDYSQSVGTYGVIIKISGVHYVARTVSDNKGNFSQTVPAGTYKVTAMRDGISIPSDLFTYENPMHMVIHPGGCAQVQFTEPQP